MISETNFTVAKKLFFTLANTVATIDYAKKFKGHGWMGIRFQTSPGDEYSEISLHLRFHHQEAKLQQEVLGLMGVNFCLLYTSPSPRDGLLSRMPSSA